MRLSAAYKQLVTLMATKQSQIDRTDSDEDFTYIRLNDEEKRILEQAMRNDFGTRGSVRLAQGAYIAFLASTRTDEEMETLREGR